MNFRTLMLSVLVVLAGCSQETDRQTPVDDLALKVIAEKAEQKKQAEQEKPKPQIVSVGRTKAERIVEAYLLSDTAKTAPVLSSIQRRLCLGWRSIMRTGTSAV